eukprot:s1688_g5.t1
MRIPTFQTKTCCCKLCRRSARKLHRRKSRPSGPESANVPGCSQVLLLKSKGPCLWLSINLSSWTLEHQ